MNARVIMIGLRRGWAEHVHFLRSRQEVVTGLLGTVGVFAVLVRWQGGQRLEGSDVPQSLLMTAGFVGFCVFSVGLFTVPLMIATDREDGTLLRVRSVPGGVPAYLVGRAVAVLCQIAVYVALMLAAGMAFAGVSPPSSPGRWLTLAWVLALGVLSVVPLGAALGSLLPGPRNAMGVLTLPVTGLMLISGVMFPVTRMPEPVQWAAQAFPLYWQGLGLRSVFLPDAALGAEIAGSWRPLETAAVLGAWALAGLLTAPWLLLRAARRESGARLAARQERRAAQGAF